MSRSRLRRPTSKSMTTVFFPFKAKPAAIFALVVVLPTPPLPEVTTIIFATLCTLFQKNVLPSLGRNAFDIYLIVLQAYFNAFLIQTAR